MPFIRQKAKVLRKNFKRKLKRKSKSLASDPTFYFAFFSVVFLFGIFLFFPELSIKSLQARDFSLFQGKVSSFYSDEDIYLKSNKNTIGETPEMAFVQQNSAVSIAPTMVVSNQALGDLVGDYISSGANKEKAILEYIVEKGDTTSSLAEKFNVSANSILWANNLIKGSIIKSGQRIIIPPVSGVIYHVKKGDTLSDIARTYKGKTDDIIAFNELREESDIFVGDILIVPDGQMPVKQSAPSVAQTPIANSYFICPHLSCKITQGLHWYNAIDFDGECGDAVVASAGGIIQKVKYGWNAGAGNYISILHPNGVTTTYGHINQSLVSAGQQVSQGQMIALMGGQPGTQGAGISTGCHTHFAVIGARNPFAK